MTEDHAIIIGIQNYPGLNKPGQAALSGVESDALEFETWVRSPEGGDVPPDNIDTILSSNFSPPAANAYNCKPAFAEVKRVFDVLRRRSLEKIAARRGAKIGRRLYIFMSGHGITPKPYGHITREVGLLMGNVDDINIYDNDSHTPGYSMAEYFLREGCFEEVFLFMDCCRDILTTAQSNIVFISNGTGEGLRFYAFGCQWGRRAKERNLDGRMQGVFTKTLLLALNGASADPDPNDPTKGIITTASLRSFLINNTREFLDKTTLMPDDRDEPDIEIHPNGRIGESLFINRVPLQKFPVVINLENPFDGEIEILTGNFIKVDAYQLTSQTNVLNLQLSRGKYILQGVNIRIVRTAVFAVKGIEDAANPATYTLKFS